MLYRFRKLLERPDHDPPLLISLEITYSAEPVEIDDEEGECAGGVSSVSWNVVAVRGPIGSYYQPEIFAEVKRILENDTGLNAEITDYAYEDFAQRFKTDIDSGEVAD